MKNAGYTIATGFVGTPIICDALTETGHVDAAYALLLQEKCPSWLYPVLRGATTIWERWDAITPDGRVNAAGIEMLSFNHYAFGAVGDWLHRTVGGLAPDAPGYRRLRIAPQPGGALTSATARHDTPYGLAESSWHLDGGHIHLQVVVPPNTSATVVVPGGDTVEVGSGTYEWRAEYAPPEPPQPEPDWRAAFAG